jgi:hypothetical protein
MRPITDILRDIRKGKAVDLASQRMAEIVQAVDETGKPGELTITIKVKPEKRGGSQKVIQVGVKAKIPEVDLPEGVFFSNEEGDLLRTDPAQNEMFSDASSRSEGRA